MTSESPVHTHDYGDVFNLLKSIKGRASGCFLEMWPQVPCVPVVALLHLPCALVLYLQNWSMESDNGFDSKDLWRLLLQLPTAGQAHAFVWLSFECLQAYKSQGLISFLLKTGFVTSDLNFLCCSF